MGDEISRIIQDDLSFGPCHACTRVGTANNSPEQEQRDLERKYEERIAARGQLKGLCNKDTGSRRVPWENILEIAISVQHNWSHGTGEVHGDASWREKFS